MTPSPRDVVFPLLAVVWAVFGVFIMRPVARGSVNKLRSVRQFRKNSARTKRANVSTAPMRGGIRL